MKEEQLKPSELPIREIDLSRFDIRQEKETLKDEEFSNLVESIKQIGIRVPIQIIEFKGSIEVLDGGRRLRAARAAGLKTIPTSLVEDVKTELEIRRDALVSNEQRKELTHEERGTALLKYYNCGGFNDTQIEQYLIKTTYTQEKHLSRGGISKAFSDMNAAIMIPGRTQLESVRWVLETDEEIRKEAKQIPSHDRRVLVTPKIIKSKDKEAVKKAQRNLIQTIKQTSGQTESYKKARVNQAIEQESDELDKKPKRTMSAEETAEAEEARRKDRVMNPFRLMGVLNGGLTKTWEGLTQQKYVPALIETETELEQKHLKPTHQFRVDLANVIPKKERTLLGNWLMFIRLAIEDMESVLEKADKTAYDTRE